MPAKGHGLAAVDRETRPLAAQQASLRRSTLPESRRRRIIAPKTTFIRPISLTPVKLLNYGAFSVMLAAAPATAHDDPRSPAEFNTLWNATLARMNGAEVRHHCFADYCTDAQVYADDKVEILAETISLKKSGATVKSICSGGAGTRLRRCISSIGLIAVERLSGHVWNLVQIIANHWGER